MTSDSPRPGLLAAADDERRGSVPLRAERRAGRLRPRWGLQEGPGAAAELPRAPRTHADAAAERADVDPWTSPFMVSHFPSMGKTRWIELGIPHPLPQNGAGGSNRVCAFLWKTLPCSWCQRDTHHFGIDLGGIGEPT